MADSECFLARSNYEVYEELVQMHYSDSEYFFLSKIMPQGGI
jgi:hypothetical protein